jgi:hypothetical protein
VLARTNISIATERSSRTQPLTDREVMDLLNKVDTVIVARGSRVETIEGSRARPSDLTGPTGNYRAPMLVMGKKLLVGYNAAALESLL